jgi:uncharacterized protein (UPF0303 family)
MSHAEPTYTVEQLESAPRVEVEHFTKEDAFALGTIAAGVIQEWDLNLSVDIVIEGDLVYRAKFKNTNVGNDEYLAGKAAVARKHDQPSLLARLSHEAKGIDTRDLSDDELKYWGGAIPIYVGGSIAATITMSGESDLVDHETTAEAVSRYLATLG